jgi:Fe-S-cluster-containing hydrogenase component 2
MEISKIRDRDQCDPDCDICLETCYPKAIIKEKGEKILEVDKNKCIGCHLCIENCSKGVFEFIPRKIYYDVITGERIKRASFEG